MRLILFGLMFAFSQHLYATDLTYAKQVTLDSRILDEGRDLLVKLPKSYDQINSKYPVLYVLHGQWDTLSTVATLDLLSSELPEFVVIGIESKGMELRPTEGDKTPFANFIEKEVLPYVQKNYSVASYSILSGHSNSGRFVLNSWLNDGSQFSAYYAFSPSLDDGYITSRVSKILVASLQSKAPLTATIANEGKHMQEPFEQLVKSLKYDLKDRFTFRKFPEQSHSTTKHASMQFALKNTFNGWVPSYETQIGGLSGLLKHYEELTIRFGFKVSVPVKILQKLTAYYATSEQSDAGSNLKQIVKYTLTEWGQKADSLFEISDYLSGNGYAAAGKTVLEEICNIHKGYQRCKL